MTDNSAVRSRHVNRRSWLFAPGDSDRKVAKALASSADIVILDLEDAVAPSSKQAARNLVVDVLRAGRSRPIAVRINAAETPWHAEDVTAIGGLQPDVLVLPKCSGAAMVRCLDERLSSLQDKAQSPSELVGILPLITETAASLFSLNYVGAGPRLCGLGFAGEDLAADLGVEARDERGLHPLLKQARNAVAIAAAAAQVPAIDTPFPDPHDSVDLQQEAADASWLGFAGKMCIHPGQINAVHAALRPSEERLAWARSVAKAFANSPEDGVTLLHGKMIDRAHLRLAERYLTAGEAE